MAKAPDPTGPIQRTRELLASDPQKMWNAQLLAAELGITVHKAANTLLYLADQGEVLRKKISTRESEYRGVPQVAA